MFRALDRRSLLETNDARIMHDTVTLETNTHIAHKANAIMQVWMPVMSQPSQYASVCILTVPEDSQ